MNKIISFYKNRQTRFNAINLIKEREELQGQKAEGILEEEHQGHRLSGTVQHFFQVQERQDGHRQGLQEHQQDHHQADQE